jgi:uncharacterized protein YkwD
MTPLKDVKRLNNIATAHANDLIKTNKFQHESSTGVSFLERMSLNDVKCPAENLYAGGRSALGVVMELLVDCDIPNLGHRKNMLNPKYTTTGLAFCKFDNLSMIMVQNFSCAE